MGREWEEGRTEVVREDGEDDAEQASDEDVRRVMAVVCVSDLLAMLLRAEDAANAPIVREMAISVAPMIGARASHALICARESSHQEATMREERTHAVSSTIKQMHLAREVQRQVSQSCESDCTSVSSAPQSLQTATHKKHDHSGNS